jgi:hypothetical protein
MFYGLWFIVYGSFPEQSNNKPQTINNKIYHGTKYIITTAAA